MGEFTATVTVTVTRSCAGRIGRRAGCAGRIGRRASCARRGSAGVISQPPGSVILRIRLGRRLRRGLREAAGITARQAAKAIRGSESKISRIELGRHAAREIDVLDLLTLYGVTGPGQRDELLALATQACLPTWWQGLRRCAAALVFRRISGWRRRQRRS